MSACCRAVATSTSCLRNFVVAVILANSGERRGWMFRGSAGRLPLWAIECGHLEKLNSSQSLGVFGVSY
jgi:hypothetical protein